MAIKVYGVRKRWRRMTRRKAYLPKYSGQKGWNWQEVIVSNSFTEIDNVPAGVDSVIDGATFETALGSSAVGGQGDKTVVIRALHMQAQVSIVQPDPELYPLVAYDVGLVKFETSTLGSTLPLSLQGIQTATNNRVFFHQRVWAAAQPGVFDNGEGITGPFGVNPASAFVNVSLTKLNLPLAADEAMGLVLSQCGSELYTDGQDALLTGYVKMFVQVK